MAKKDWRNKLYNNLKKLGIISENGVTMKDVQNNNTTGKPWIDAIIRAGEALSGTDTWVDRAADNAAQQGDYKRVAEIGKDAIKGAAEGYMASLVLPEFATYGFPIGLARLGVGTVAGATSGTIGGYVGSGADQLIHDLSGGKYNRNIGRNTLGLTSSLIGFGAGMKSLNPVLRKAAGKGITFSKIGMLEETFNGLRNEYFNKVASNALSKSIPNIVQKNILAGKIGWAPKQSFTLWHNSDKPLNKLHATYPAWDVTQRGAPLGHVWMSGNETTQGFLAKRPYHFKSDVVLEKPMIQLNEAIGDGKNVTRNDILDFAQKSSSDGLHFSNISDNTLQNQDIYAIFKDIKLDNFHNPDIKYKQGGTLKAQPGTVLPTIPSVLTRTYNKLENTLTPINKWEQKYNVKANASLGPLELLNPEAWVGIDIETLDKAHRGVQLVEKVKPIKEFQGLSPKARMELLLKSRIKQPVTKSEKGLYTYVKNKHHDDLANWETYMDEYLSYWK